MELDDLKYQLQHRLGPDTETRSQEDIAAIMSRKASSVTEKLQRNLWFEIICSICVVIGFFVISYLTSYYAIRIYFNVFAVLAIGFIILLYFLLQRTRRLSATALPVKRNLQMIVTIMEEFMKRYFQFTMALIPVCFVFAFILMNTEHRRIPAAEHLSRSHFSSSWKVIVFLTAYFVVLFTGVYYFTKWYLRKLYGKYVEQLKTFINDLEEGEK